MSIALEHALAIFQQEGEAKPEYIAEKLSCGSKFAQGLLDELEAKGQIRKSEEYPGLYELYVKKHDEYIVKPFWGCVFCYNKPFHINAGDLPGRHVITMEDWWPDCGEEAIKVALCDDPDDTLDIHVCNLVKA